MSTDRQVVMEEQLQSLLDRIQRDGVEKAEAQAEEVVAAARAEARRIVEEAERAAVEKTAKAQHEAGLFLERSTTTLEQSGRDFLLQLRGAIERVLQESAREAIGEALTPETMAAMLENLAATYADRDFNEHRIEVLVSPEDRERFVQTMFDNYRDLVSHGLNIEVDERIDKGFKVGFVDYRLYHDFTVEAIADALSVLLKPPLDDIVRRAAVLAQEANA